jgi:hypothetical protein
VIAAAASQTTLPVSWCRANTGSGDHDADDGDEVFGDDGLRRRLRALANVAAPALLALRASPLVCRTARMNEMPSATKAKTSVP